MPSKGRWTLNPRKWFGAIAHNSQKREKRAAMNTAAPPPMSPPVIVRTMPSNSSNPRPLAGKGKTKVIPALSVTAAKTIPPIRTEPSFVQFQMPAFGIRREPTSTFLSSTRFSHRLPAFVPTRTEPSIRKNPHLIEELSVDATRWNTPVTLCDNSKSLLSPSLTSQGEPFQRGTYSQEQLDMNISNISNQCLIGYAQPSRQYLLEKSSVSSRTRSSSSLDDIDDVHESSSSGIFTDERADLNEGHRTASKDTLSTLEVLSIESIIDSETSLNRCSTRPTIHHFRPTMSPFESLETKSTFQRPLTLSRAQRARSAEGLLKDTPITTPVTPRNRLSSAAIVKKIEKRVPTSRSPPETLGRAGFVRVDNDTYRLTTDKPDHLYRRHRQNSIVPPLDSDDSLPPAHDEESYARLPRASSTEQLNNDIQNDLRALVDEYLRPVMATKTKPLTRSNQVRSRAKRAHTPIKLEEITDKLFSSIDCSIYAQYQRYC